MAKKGKTTKTTKTEKTPATTAAPATEPVNLVASVQQAAASYKAPAPSFEETQAAVQAYAAPAATAQETMAVLKSDAPVTTPGQPVQVRFEGKETNGSVKAVIRYHGPLARADRVVALVGLEWFGSPRWQAQREVELRRHTDGAYEAELSLARQDGRGADLMALQLAFQAPTTRDWDSAGAPYGYYQVSALNGFVEAVRQ